MSMVGLHLGFWQTWFVLSIRTLLLAIPIQGIAGIGTGQAGGGRERCSSRA